jgi:hypothetical protein
MPLYRRGKPKSIPLKKLKPDQENFRFEPFSSVVDTVSVMIGDQETSLYNLGEDIVKNGLNPADLVMVCPGTDAGTYVVIDGNRRLISLMALLDPSIIPASMTTLRHKFEKLSSANSEVTGDERVRCVVFPDKTSAEYWIGKEHSGVDDGKGKDDWNPVQKDRFTAETTGVKPMAFSAWEFAKKDADEDTQRLMKKPGFYSSFRRIVESKPGREAMGISEIEDDGTVVSADEAIARKSLRTIIQDFGSGSTDVNAIRKANDIKKYMAGVKERVTGKKATRTKKGGKGAGYPRSTLIPSKCPLAVSDTKIATIFDELRTLKVEKWRFGASFLLRALLELSMAKYVKVNLQFAKTLTNPKKEKELHYRLEKLFEYLEKDPAIGRRTLVPYKKATLENKHVPLTEELNAYVHNPTFIPNPKDLITTWDNIEGLMQIIWKEIARAEATAP